MNPPTSSRRANLPRLPPDYYRGCAVVHWTMAIDGRETGWLDPAFHGRFREILLHTLARYGLACPAYCLMPDHLHVIWAGLKPASDQRLASVFFRKQVNAALRPCRLQLQAFDHVLRAQERRGDEMATIVEYVLQNPVRAGLCRSREEYAYANALIAGYPDLDVRQADFREVFWRIYCRLVAVG